MDDSYALLWFSVSLLVIVIVAWLVSWLGVTVVTNADLSSAEERLRREIKWSADHQEQVSERSIEQVKTANDLTGDCLERQIAELSRRLDRLESRT